MSVYPIGIDPEVGSSPTATLDVANHTNLHNTLSSGMNKVQLLLGSTPTGTEPASKSLRQRMVDAETWMAANQPIATVAVTDRLPGQTATVSWSGMPNRVLTLGIPSGMAGTNGTNGKDGVSLVAASGVVGGKDPANSTAPTLTPIKAGSIVGIDVNFGKDLGFVPTVVCTPIQDTVATTGGGVTTAFTKSVLPSGSPTGTPPTTTYATYEGGGVKRTGTEAAAGTCWHGQYSTNNGHQHCIIVLGDAIKNALAALPKAEITKVEVSVTTPATTVEAQDADQITVHQSGLAVVPATHLNSAVTGAYKVFKKVMTPSAAYTFELPSSWYDGFKSGTIASLIFGPERVSDTDSTLSTSVNHYGAIQAKLTQVTVYYSITTVGTPTKIDSIPVDVGVRDVTSTKFRLVVRNSGTQDEKVRVSWMASP